MKDREKQIADFYGLQVQAIKLAEECAEFAASSSKVFYYYSLLDGGSSTPVSRAGVREQFETAREQNAEELADVLLMARQVSTCSKVSRNSEPRSTSSWKPRLKDN